MTQSQPFDLATMRADRDAGTPGECFECGQKVKKICRRFCSQKCYGAFNGRRLRKTEMWRKPNKRGYVTGTVWTSEGVQLLVRQHRWVMEQHLGQKLLPSQDVHHINGNKSDNRIENLEVIDHSAHSSLHNLDREHPVRKKYKISAKDRDRRIMQCADMRARKAKMMETDT